MALLCDAPMSKIKLEDKVFLCVCDEKGMLSSSSEQLLSTLWTIYYTAAAGQLWLACRCTSCRQWLSRPIEYTTKTAAWGM